MDPQTDIMAFIGGYFAHCFTGYYLKYLFAVFLVLSALFMLNHSKNILHVMGNISGIGIGVLANIAVV